jgi:hypothetical protein
MTSLAGWTGIWFWYCVIVVGSVAGSFGVLELGSVLWAHVTGQKHLVDWTLSDTVRRWRAGNRWLAPVFFGFVVFTIWLGWHFFFQNNPA